MSSDMLVGVYFCTSVLFNIFFSVLHICFPHVSLLMN